MNPRGSSCVIRLLARCAALSLCAGCGGITLEDLAHKKLAAALWSDVSPVVVSFGYDTTNGCYSLTSVRASLNGVPLSVSPGGPSFAEGQQNGCNFPSLVPRAGVTIPPNADGEYEVVLFDSSMQISAKFGDFFVPAVATLRSPIERVAHPQDEVVVDFSPAPMVANIPGALPTSVGAGFSLDTRELASYPDVQLTGSSARFRLPTNVLGQGRLLTWWVFGVPTHHCDGAEVCSGTSAREVDLGPFEIRPP